MAKTTISLNEETIDDILTLVEWGLSSYPDPFDDRYNRIIKLATRLEKAKCKIKGEEWDESLRWE